MVILIAYGILKLLKKFKDNGQFFFRYFKTKQPRLLENNGCKNDIMMIESVVQFRQWRIIKYYTSQKMTEKKTERFIGSSLRIVYNGSVAQLGITNHSQGLFRVYEFRGVPLQLTSIFDNIDELYEYVLFVEECLQICDDGLMLGYTVNGKKKTFELKYKKRQANISDAISTIEQLRNDKVKKMRQRQRKLEDMQNRKLEVRQQDIKGSKIEERRRKELFEQLEQRGRAIWTKQANTATIVPVQLFKKIFTASYSSAYTQLITEANFSDAMIASFEDRNMGVQGVRELITLQWHNLKLLDLSIWLKIVGGNQLTNEAVVLLTIIEWPQLNLLNLSKNIIDGLDGWQPINILTIKQLQLGIYNGNGGNNKLTGLPNYLVCLENLVSLNLGAWTGMSTTIVCKRCL